MVLALLSGNVVFRAKCKLMVNYIIRRILIMIPTLAVISVLVFTIIQLPPGDIITSRLQELQAEGQDISEEQIIALRE